LLSACISTENHTVVQVTYRGAATKGPLSGSTVSVYAMDSSGNKTGSPLAQTTTVNGEWTISVSNPDNDLLIVEADGGEYIDESDPETDIIYKRKIILEAGQVLTSILIPGETTAAINFFTYTLVENFKKEIPKSANLIEAFNRVRSRSYNTLGFDALVEIPADPIQPSVTSTAVEKTYALLIGGAAYAINNAALKTGETQITYNMLKAMVKDLADCELDGFVDGQDISPLSSLLFGISIPQGLFDDIKLEDEVLRFRNNNYEQYVDAILPTWDQVAFCEVDPELSVTL
jgi:hypothetical protein